MCWMKMKPLVHFGIEFECVLKIYFLLCVYTNGFGIPEVCVSHVYIISRLIN